MSNLLDTLPPLRDVIRAHGLRAEKKLGQNFLLDQNLTDKIVRHAGDLAGTVFEIGPGPGGLTRSLLRGTKAHIVAIEYDARAVEALQSLHDAAAGRINVLSRDALNTDLTTLGYAPPYHIVANLPYNIATPLLIGWLKQIREKQAFQSMTLMFQKEVAQRIAAPAGSHAYGRLSVIAQWLCDTKLVFDVPGSAFTPPPKVTSSIVRLIPRDLPATAPLFETVETVTAAAFGQRRKMIRSSLKAYLPVIENLGIDPQKRAEDLRVEEFIAIAQG